jgi:hypothetical protein
VAATGGGGDTSLRDHADEDLPALPVDDPAGKTTAEPPTLGGGGGGRRSSDRDEISPAIWTSPMTRLPQDDALIWAVAAENGRAGLELDGAAARATAERSRAPDGGGRGSPSSDEEEMCPAVWWSPMTTLPQDDALIWTVPAENGREGAL